MKISPLYCLCSLLVALPTVAQIPTAALTTAIPAVTAEDPLPQGKRLTPTKKEVDKAIAQGEALLNQRSAGNRLRLNTAAHINVTPGTNEILPIARSHANRIVTPFRSPEIVSTNLTGGSAKEGNCGELCVKGNVIYVSTDKTEAVSMFITEQGSEDQAISVTMLPKNIPPREIFLQMKNQGKSSPDSYNLQRSDNPEAAAFEKSLPYVETLRTVMRHLALGKIPPGYTKNRIQGAQNVPSCHQEGLTFNFTRGQRFSGQNWDIYVGTANNISNDPIEFEETACGSWQTAAVASWPLHVLEPRQSTEIFIVMKEFRPVTEKTERPSLITPDYNYR